MTSSIKLLNEDEIRLSEDGTDFTLTYLRVAK